MKPLIPILAAVVLFAFAASADAQCFGGRCYTPQVAAYQPSYPQAVYYQQAPQPMQPPAINGTPQGGMIRGPWIGAGNVRTFYARRGWLSWLFGRNVTYVTFH